MRRHVLTGIAIALVAADLLIRLSIPAHSQSAPYGRFAGSWPTHGGVLWIGPRGNGYYHMRTYVDCSATILTDCDKFKGNFIYPGGFATFSLTRVSGNVTSGAITNSSTSWEIATKISFTLRSNDVLIARGASDLLNGRPFCGPRAPAGACGA